MRPTGTRPSHTLIFSDFYPILEVENGRSSSRNTGNYRSSARRVVDKLDDSNGCISAQALWKAAQWYVALACKPFNILMSCSVPADARSSDPAVARQGIRQMKDVLHPFVSALGSSHDAYISSTRLQFGVPHLTLADLPSKTILHILRYTDDSQKAASLIRYSHISSKIRNTILDLATIRLHLKMPVHIIETVANRGIAFGLTVDICFEYNEPNHCAMEKPTSNPMLISLSKLIKYHHRWKDVKLTINGRPAAKYIAEQFPCNYASIRRLNINICYFGLGPNGDFFRNWTMPHLEFGTVLAGHRFCSSTTCEFTGIVFFLLGRDHCKSNGHTYILNIHSKLDQLKSRVISIVRT